MNKKTDEHTLEFLLNFHGFVHVLEEDYWIKFEAKKVTSTHERPHGLKYSLTLHQPDGNRILGFDNAHRIRTTKGYQDTADHWHRTEDDEGRPYIFTNADTLLADFFREVRRVLSERGLSDKVVGIRQKGEPS